jgi:hypothetical protein
MRALSLLPLLLVPALATSLAAQAAPSAAAATATRPAAQRAAAPRNMRFGLKFGLISSGEAYIEESDSFLDIDGGIGGEAFVDYALGPRFSGGLFLGIDNVSAADASEMLTEFGFTLKATVGDTARRVTWHPLFGIGWARMNVAAAGPDALSFLTLRAGPEVRMRTASGQTWVAELLAYGAPSGGNDAVTVTYGPMVRVRAGLIF